MTRSAAGRKGGSSRVSTLAARSTPVMIGQNADTPQVNAADIGSAGTLGLKPIAVPVTRLTKAEIRARVRAYVTLTKPRIVELLLVTTVPTMFLAAGRLPGLWLTLVVVVGWALAAGAANAFNG